MSANVALSDTFDQWRMKTNEWLSMTNSAGSSNFIKLANTTDSTSNTTGAITTAGGLAATSSVVVGENLTLFGAVDAVGTTNLDAVDIDGAVQIDGAVTVGVDGTGYDVKLFGATSGQYLLWDESADDLILSSDTFLNIEGTRASTSSTTGSFRTAGGVGIAKKLFVGEDVDVNGTTNLDVVDIDGATQIDAAVTVGVDDTGYDVKFFGATSGAYLLWDQSADDLIIAGGAAISIDATTDASSTTTGSFHTDGGVGIAKKLYVGTDLDVNGTTNLDAVDIDGTTQIDAAVTVGVNGTGLDVKFFGDTSSAYMLWDQSEDDLILAGAAAISIDATTDSSSTTTGSFHTDGGVGIAAKLFVGTDLDVNGITNLDVVDIDGTTQIDATLSVGVDAIGYDVKLFGDTSGKYWLWDDSGANNLTLEDSEPNTLLVMDSTDGAPGSNEGDNILLDGLIISGGYLAFEISSVQHGGTVLMNSTDGAPGADAGDQIITEDFVLEIGSSKVTAVSDLQQTGTITVGVDDTGHDVKLFGATAGAYLLWDQFADDLIIAGGAAISIDATTDASSTTTGSFHTDGGVGIAKKLYVGTDLDVNGTTNLDAVDIDGTTQIDAAVTVGVNGTGLDVKFFGDTSSAYMLWDQSEDDLILAGAAAISIDATTDSSSTTTGSFHTDGGVGIAAKLFVGTDLDVNGTTNLDAVDIDGAVQIDATLSVGVDSTGQDVKFFGATSGKSWLFDESGSINVIGEDGDDLIVLNSTDGAPGADEGDNIILDAFIASGGYMSLENIQGTGDSGYSASQGGGGVILNSTDGAPGADAGDQIITEDFVLEIGISGITAVSDLQQTGTITVGVDDTGHNVKFFGATADKSFLWDQSADSLIVTGTTTLTGTTNLDVVDIDGATQIDATLSVGINDTGHDVKLFGATASAYLLWDQSEDDLILAGAAAISIDATTDSSSTTTGSFHTDGGVGIAKKLFVGTDLDVNGITNLDDVDIDGAVQIDAAVTVGVDGTGADVKFFGATAGKYWLWDESEDKTIQVSDSQLTGELTVGVDDTGHDVIFYGAAAGALMMWDQSEDSLLVRGASADAAGSSGKILLQTGQAAVADGDIIGRIDWNAPAEDSTDGDDVGASIWAEADAAFSATVNSTDLVFATGDSGVATEKLRIDSTGQVTFADGAIDVDIVSHYSAQNGLKLGGTLLTATASELNDIIDRSATVGYGAGMAMIFG